MNNGRIAYSYRENTVDNDFNHLIILTYLEMKKYFSKLPINVIENDNDVGKIIKELMLWAPSFKKTNIKKLIKGNMNKISQPYYLPYEKLRVTCIRILQHIGISIWSDTDEEEVGGILFYVPDLWECYVDYVLKENTSLKYKTFTDERETIRILAKIEQEYKNPTYPDFVFFEHDCPYMVLDAKYRPKYEIVMKKGKLQGKNYDFWNDYNKCVRDMVSIGGQACGFIFPMKIGDENEHEEEYIVEFLISKFNEKARFYLFPLYIPVPKENEDYGTWDKRIEKFNKKTGEALMNNSTVTTRKF